MEGNTELIRLLESALALARGGAVPVTGPAPLAEAYDLDEMEAFTMPFGVHKGKTIREILEEKREYVEYLRDKFGVVNGVENPDFALKNARVRSYCNDLLTTDALPSMGARPEPSSAPAPAAPSGESGGVDEDIPF